MPMVATRAGRALIAKALKGEAPDPSDAIRVGLFTNVAPTTTTPTHDDFTTALFGGYANVSSTYGDTTGPTLDGDDQKMRITGDAIIWDCTSDPQTIRGWYLWDLNTDEILFYEGYATPHVLEVGSRHTLFCDIAVGACG